MNQLLNRLKTLSPKTADRLTMAFLVLLPPLFFWRETLGWLTLAEADVIFWFFPAYKLAVEQVGAGLLPLWNANLYSGTALFAQWEVGLLDPLNWIYLLGVNARTLTVVAEAGFATALLATYSYVRSLGLRRRAAVLAAVIYAFSGFVIARTIYPGLFHATAITPFVLWSVERIYQKSQWQKGRWRDVAVGALFVAWQIMTGHPQPFVYSSLLAGFYALFCAFVRRDDEDESKRKRWNFMLRVTVMFIASALLTAVQLLPAIELSGQSIRKQVPFEFYALNSLHPVSLLVTLFPFLHGAGRGIYHLPYWGSAWTHNEAQFYLGVATMSLAFAAAVSLWRERSQLVKFWSAVAVIAIVCALGKFIPPVAWALSHMPLLGNFRSPNRHWMEVTLAVAVLAGYAVDRLLSERSHRLVKMTVIAAGALTALCALFAAIVLWRREMIERFVRGTSDLSFLPRGFLQQAGAEFYLPVITALGLLIVLMIFTGAAQRRRWYPLLLTFVILDFNLYAAFAPVSHPGKPEELVGQSMPPGLRGRQSEQQAVRFHLLLGPDESLFGPFWFYGYEMATGYDPLLSSRYQVFSGINEAGRSEQADLPDQRNRVLDLLNVRYLLVTTSYVQTPAFSQHVTSQPKWREVEVGKNVQGYQGLRAFENLSVMPRAWLAERVEIRSAEEQLHLIHGESAEGKSLTFDPTVTAFVEPGDAAQLPAELLSQSAGIESPAVSAQDDPRILKRTSQSLSLTTESAKPSLLVLSEPFAPGWHAQVDGREAEILRVNYLLRGVILSPGQHHIELWYWPRTLTVGAAISLTTAVLLFGVVFWEKKKRST